MRHRKGCRLSSKYKPNVGVIFITSCTPPRDISPNDIFVKSDVIAFGEMEESPAITLRLADCGFDFHRPAMLWGENLTVLKMIEKKIQG